MINAQWIEKMCGSDEIITSKQGNNPSGTPASCIVNGNIVS